jgi:plasmid stabilization system protein ParE
MAARRLIWLPEALEDIARLDAFLRLKSPEAAARSARTILDAVRDLQDFPERGRPSDLAEGFRDLIVPFGRNAYVLRYRIDRSLVVIVRLWHGREDR